MFRHGCLNVFWAAFGVCATVSAYAAPSTPTVRNPQIPTPVAQAAEAADQSSQIAQMVRQGVAYLRASQAPDGSFSSDKGPGVTAVALTALMASGLSADDASVSRGLSYLEDFIRTDGGIYREGSLYRNYETCLAIMAFQAVNDPARYGATLSRAAAFVKGLQWDAGEGFDASSDNFGGAGYGSHKRPDLSNTAFLLEALHSLGTEPNDPAIQAALVFVSRCQNFESPHNQSKFPPLNPDGGFYYTIAAGGSSQAGETPDGGLRSYGSMTYAGLKSMIYAGVSQDDPRVQAALEWIGAHYSLETNPGMGDAGYFYYLHTFAKALDASGRRELIDDQGEKHDWRRDLIAEVAQRQQDDGSWVNDNERWLESDKPLVTSYAILALAHAK